MTDKTTNYLVADHHTNYGAAWCEIMETILPADTEWEETDEYETRYYSVFEDLESAKNHAQLFQDTQ